MLLIYTYTTHTLSHTPAKGKRFGFVEGNHSAGKRDRYMFKKLYVQRYNDVSHILYLLTVKSQFYSTLYICTYVHIYIQLCALWIYHNLLIDAL